MQKDITRKKVFGNSEFYSSRLNHSTPNSLENCGFVGKKKLRVSKTFWGDIFLYFMNIFATAAPKLKPKISKIIVLRTKCYEQNNPELVAYYKKYLNKLTFIKRLAKEHHYATPKA